MVLEETSRRLLHQSAVRALGAEAADVLMEHLPPAGWGELARRTDVEHETALLRLEIGTLREEMRGEFAAVRAETAGEFASVRAETAGGFASVRAEMAGGFAAARGELAAVRAELGTQIQSAMVTQTRWMVAVLLALGALFTTVNALGH